IEHVFRRSDQLVGLGELDAIRKRGRTPLLTVEPWAGLGDLIGRLGALGPCLLRYGHEMNGTWYPWSLDPDKLMFELGYIAYHKPSNGLGGKAGTVDRHGSPARTMASRMSKSLCMQATNAT